MTDEVTSDLPSDVDYDCWKNRVYPRSWSEADEPGVGKFIKAEHIRS